MNERQASARMLAREASHLMTYCKDLFLDGRDGLTVEEFATLWIDGSSVLSLIGGVAIVLDGKIVGLAAAPPYLDGVVSIEGNHTYITTGKRRVNVK